MNLPNSIGNQHFRVRWKPNAKGGLKVVVSKKVGKATQRNLIKRIVRECFRLYPTQFPSGEVVVIAKSPLGILKRKAIWQYLKNSLRGEHD